MAHQRKTSKAAPAAPRNAGDTPDPTTRRKARLGPPAGPKRRGPQVDWLSLAYLVLGMGAYPVALYLAMRT